MPDVNTNDMNVYKWLAMVLVQAGHVCGDDVDLIDGRPTGSIRISFGYCSTFSDAETFLRFIRECFLHVQPKKGGSDDVVKEPAKIHQPEVSSSVEIPNDSFALNNGHVFRISYLFIFFHCLTYSGILRIANTLSATTIMLCCN